MFCRFVVSYRAIEKTPRGAFFYTKASPRLSLAANGNRADKRYVSADGRRPVRDGRHLEADGRSLAAKTANTISLCSFLDPERKGPLPFPGKEDAFRPVMRVLGSRRQRRCSTRRAATYK